MPFSDVSNSIISLSAGVKGKKTIKGFFQHALLCCHVGAGETQGDIFVDAEKAVIKGFEKVDIVFAVAQDAFVAGIKYGLESHVSLLEKGKTIILL